MSIYLKEEAFGLLETLTACRGTVESLLTHDPGGIQVEELLAFATTFNSKCSLGTVVACREESAGARSL